MYRLYTLPDVYITGCNVCIMRAQFIQIFCLFVYLETLLIIAFFKRVLRLSGLKRGRPIDSTQNHLKALALEQL